MTEIKYFHGGNVIVHRFHRKFKLIFIPEKIATWQEREQYI
jgi:hypothetical protein